MIENDGAYFALTPLQDEGVDKQVGSSVMVVGEKEFLKTLKEENGQGYAIMIRPKSVLTVAYVDDVPKDFQTLLNKYIDIVLKDLPSCLFSISDVSHHIDLIPGAIFSNKATYKMTP